MYLWGRVNVCVVGKQKKKKRKGGKEGKKDWEGSDIGLWVKWEIYVEIVNKNGLIC